MYLLAESDCSPPAVLEPSWSHQRFLHQSQALGAFQNASRGAPLGACPRHRHPPRLSLSSRLDLSTRLGPCSLLRPTCRLRPTHRLGSCPWLRSLWRRAVTWGQGPGCTAGVQKLWRLLSCVAVDENTVNVGGAQRGGKLVDAGERAVSAEIGRASCRGRV